MLLGSMKYSLLYKIKIFLPKKAVRALKNFTHSFKSLETLNEILCNEKYFYKVRKEAAFSMTNVMKL